MQVRSRLDVLTQKRGQKIVVHPSPSCSDEPIWGATVFQSEPSSLHLLAQGRCELGEGVLQAELADEGAPDGGEARHAHHQRKVALDGLADARVAHLHRHHYACSSKRDDLYKALLKWHGRLSIVCPAGFPHASQQIAAKPSLLCSRRDAPLWARLSGMSC